MDFLLKAISAFAGNFLSGLISSVLTGVTEIFQKYVYLFITDSLVTTAQKAVVGISIPLIVLFTIKQYFDVYIMETSGDPESDPLDVLVRGAASNRSGVLFILDILYIYELLFGICGQCNW